MAKLVQISSEEEAFEILEKIIKQNAQVMPADIEFVGWPILQIKLVGEKFDSSLTPTVMKSLLGLQTEIYRAYAIARYNTTNTRKLTQEERDALEIQVKVDKGSSKIDIELEGLLRVFLQEAVGKMDSIHIVVVVLGVATFYFGSQVIRQYIQTRRDIRMQEIDADQQKVLADQIGKMSLEETKRTELITELAKQNYALQNISESAQDVHAHLIKGISAADTANLDGYELTGETADILSKNARRKSSEIRIDGVFRITRVDSSDPALFRVRVYNTVSDELIEATVQDTDLSRSNKKALQEAEWQREAVHLEINAKKVGDDIRNAVIIGVRRIES